MNAANTFSLRRPGGAAITLALLAALGGCGGGGGGSDPAPSQPEPAQPSQPAISVQAADQSAAPGASATFSVTASGGGLSYQWTRNGVAIDGATGASYTIPSVAAQDNAAVYRVNVKNTVGAVWSAKALLAVSGDGVFPYLGAPGLPPASVAAPGTASNPDDGVALRGQEASLTGRAGLAVDTAGVLYSAWNDQVSKVERGALTPWVETRSLGGLGAYPEIIGLAAGGKGSLYALARYNRRVETGKPLRWDSARQLSQIEVTDNPNAAGPLQWTGVASDSADTGYFVGSQLVRACGTCEPEPQVLLLRAPAGAAGAALLYTPLPGLYGAASALRFTQPGGIAVGADGSIYLADRGNHTIVRVTQAGQATVYAGVPGVAGSVNGERAAARFNAPASLALDGAGNLYVVDSGSNTIRKITPAGVVSTVAGEAGANTLAYGRLPGRLPAVNHLAAAADGTLYAAVEGGVVKVQQAR